MALVLLWTAAVAVEEHLFLASPHDWFGGQEGHETTRLDGFEVSLVSMSPETEHKVSTDASHDPESH